MSRDDLELRNELIAKENFDDEFFSYAKEFGVVPEIFEQYYSLVTEEFPMLKGSELRIRMITGEALCSDCNALYNVMKNEGQCPRCQSRFKTVLGGTDIILQQIGY